MTPDQLFWAAIFSGSAVFLAAAIQILFFYLNNSKIERFKHELQIAATEKSIKLTKVFEKQAEVIAELYAKLAIMVIH